MVNSLLIWEQMENNSVSKLAKNYEHPAWASILLVLIKQCGNLFSGGYFGEQEGKSTKQGFCQEKDLEKLRFPTQVLKFKIKYLLEDGLTDLWSWKQSTGLTVNR